MCCFVCRIHAALWVTSLGKKESEIDDETESFILSSFSKYPGTAVGVVIMRALVASESINVRLYLYALPGAFLPKCSREQQRIKIESVLVLYRARRSADGASLVHVRQIPSISYW